MDQPTVNKKYFLGIIKDRGMSLREVAAKMGFNHHAQLSRIFSNERRMQLDEAVNLSRILGLTFDDVIAHAGYPDAVRAGPRLKVVGALNGKGEVVAVTKVERAVAPSGMPVKSVAIQARTADTALSWMDAWVFFCVEPTSVKDSAFGRFCYAKIKGGPTVLATVRRGYASGSVNLSGPYNRQNAALDWAEPIIATRN